MWLFPVSKIIELELHSHKVDWVHKDFEPNDSVHVRQIDDTSQVQSRRSKGDQFQSFCPSTKISKDHPFHCRWVVNSHRPSTFSRLDGSVQFSWTTNFRLDPCFRTSTFVDGPLLGLWNLDRLLSPSWTVHFSPRPSTFTLTRNLI